TLKSATAFAVAADTVAPPMIASASDIDGDSLCLSSDNVILLIDRITANFTSAFNICVDKLVSAIEKKFDHRLDCQSSEIFELNKKIDSLERQNKHLESSNTQLNDKINHLNTAMESLSASVDDLEQYSRNSNLLIHGVPLM